VDVSKTVDTLCIPSWLAMLDAGELLGLGAGALLITRRR